MEKLCFVLSQPLAIFSMLLPLVLQCCTRLQTLPLLTFSDVRFFHHGLLPHRTALRRWEQFARHGWRQLCPQQLSLLCCSSNPCFRYRPTWCWWGPSYQGHCPTAVLLRDHRLCPWDGCLEQKLFKELFLFMLSHCMDWLLNQSFPSTTLQILFTAWWSLLEEFGYLSEQRNWYRGLMTCVKEEKEITAAIVFVAHCQ